MRHCGAHTVFALLKAAGAPCTYTRVCAEHPVQLATLVQPSMGGGTARLQGGQSANEQGGSGSGEETEQVSIRALTIAR